MTAKAKKADQVEKKATEQPAEKNAPVQVFRLRGVKVALFENKVKDGDKESTFFKVSAQKIYREGTEFKTTTSFGVQDVPVLIHLLNQSWVWAMETDAARYKAANGGGE